LILRSVISASVKPYTANFARTVCGVQNARPDRCPETVGAARVDDVALGIGRKAR
jgi:hypothetical protein